MSDYPRPLTGLILSAAGVVDQLTGALETEQLSLFDWQSRMQETLVRFHAGAFLAGKGAFTLERPERRYLRRLIEREFRYLGDFTAEIQEATEWRKGWNARARSYAKKIKDPYWKGRVEMRPLPFMPAQGTVCHNNCGCSWRRTNATDTREEWLWVRGKNDSCQTCLEREAGNPYVLEWDGEGWVYDG